MRPASPRFDLVTGLTALMLAVLFIGFCAIAFRAGSAADFRALWLAGQYLADGRPDLVYPNDATVFSMRPPEAWIADMKAAGFVGEIYPFIYPPLWAWLTAELTGWISYDTLMNWVVWINPALLVVMLAAAHKLSAPDMRLWVYLGAGILLLLVSPVGLIALHQSQPQILVACLTVLAVERAEHRSPVVAGLCLALAASIKLYPAFFALFWLAAGHRRAAAFFLVFGSGLAGLSVAVVGWPLHAEFLHMVKVISDTALVTRLSFALESVVAQVCCLDQLMIVPAPVPDPMATDGQGWYVLEKPWAMAVLFKAAQLAALIGLAVRFGRSQSVAERAALWPAAFALITLLGPIGWAYHFLATLAFLPSVFVLFRLPVAAMVCTVFAILTVSIKIRAVADLLTQAKFVQLFGTLAIILLIWVFWSAADQLSRRRRDPGC